MRSQELLVLLGKLIKRERALRMDQHEFATRLGCGVATVSRMERGLAVNAGTLFAALELLDILDPLIVATDNLLVERLDAPQRKRSRMEDKYANDF